MIQNRIDERTAIMSCCRMNDHPLWLIDHKQIRILVKNIERNIFRLNGERFRFRKLQMYHIPFRRFIAGTDQLLICKHISVPDHFLNIGAGQLRKTICKKSVNPYSVLRRCHCNLFFFCHLSYHSILQTVSSDKTILGYYKFCFRLLFFSRIQTLEIIVPI